MSFLSGITVPTPVEPTSTPIPANSSSPTTSTTSFLSGITTPTTSAPTSFLSGVKYQPDLYQNYINKGKEQVAKANSDYANSPIGLATNAVKAIPGAFNDVVTKPIIKSAETGNQVAAKGWNEGGMQGALDVASGTAGTLLSLGTPISAPITKSASEIGNFLGARDTVLQKMAVDYPQRYKTVETYVRNIQKIMQVLMAIIPMGGAIGDILTSGADSAISGARAVSEAPREIPVKNLSTEGSVVNARKIGDLNQSGVYKKMPINDLLTHKQETYTPELHNKIKDIISGNGIKTDSNGIAKIDKSQLTDKPITILSHKKNAEAQSILVNKKDFTNGGRYGQKLRSALSKGGYYEGDKVTIQNIKGRDYIKLDKTNLTQTPKQLSFSNKLANTVNKTNPFKNGDVIVNMGREEPLSVKGASRTDIYNPNYKNNVRDILIRKRVFINNKNLRIKLRDGGYDVPTRLSKKDMNTVKVGDESFVKIDNKNFDKLPKYKSVKTPEPTPIKQEVKTPEPTPIKQEVKTPVPERPILKNGQRITKGAYEANLKLVQDGHDALPTELQSKYTPKSYNLAKDKLANMMSADMKSVQNMALTGKDIPNDIPEPLVLNAVRLAEEAKPKLERNYQLIRDLQKSPIHTQISEAAQTMGSHGFSKGGISSTDYLDRATKTMDSGNDIPSIRNVRNRITRIAKATMDYNKIIDTITC